MKILSTRVLDVSTVSFARKKGWEVEVLPFIETFGILTKQDAELILNLTTLRGNHYLLILTSINGVKWLKKGLEGNGMKLPSGLTALCVGKKTATRAAEQLKAVPFFITENSIELLNVIKKNFETGIRFIYPCAKARMDLLPEGMKAEGYELREFAVYETIATPVRIPEAFNVILFFSPSAVESFFSMNSWPEGALGLCVGETTATSLRNRGIEKILTPEVPDELEMFKLLDSYFLKG
jgi:uroporphyrinogen-III synthase